MHGASKYQLGNDVVAAIAKAKTDFQMNRLRPHEGNGLWIPQASKPGSKLYEAQVGEARAGDTLGKAGSRRLVLLVLAGRIEEIYFSDDHYRPQSWRLIIDA